MPHKCELDTCRCRVEVLEARLSKLEAVRRAAVLMNERMKLINGPEDNCIHALGLCANHGAIHAMDEALKASE